MPIPAEEASDLRIRLRAWGDPCPRVASALAHENQLAPGCMFREEAVQRRAKAAGWPLPEAIYQSPGEQHAHQTARVKRRERRREAAARRTREETTAHV
jgi:hypothetical protein